MIKGGEGLHYSLVCRDKWFLNLP